VESNEQLNVATLIALDGAGPVFLYRRPAWNDVFFAEIGTATACFLTAVCVQNYSAEFVVVK